MKKLAQGEPYVRPEINIKIGETMNEGLILPSSIEGELDGRVSARLKEAYFPAPGIVNELTTIALYSSFETEERRKVKFSLSYARPELGDAAHSWDAIRFKSPRPLTKAEVVKLAPALDPSISSIGILGDCGSLKIWGILNHGASIKRMLCDERSSASSAFQSWAMPFIVQVLVPGTLSFWLGDFQIMTLIRGTVFEPYSYLFKRGGRVAKLIDEWAQILVAHEMFRRDQLERVLRRMVRKLRELNHGGTIIISPRPDSQDFRAGHHGWLNHDIISKRLIERIAEMEGESQKLRESGVLPASSGEIPRRITERSDLLNDAIDAMVMLSQVDGALILSTELSIVTFGAIIEVDQSHDFATFVCSDPAGKIRQPYDLSLRGTRHQSAASYCANHPQALAFVQSDDGTLSVFTGCEEGQVLCWQNVEPDDLLTVTKLDSLISQGYPLPKDLFLNGKSVGVSLHRT